MKNKLITITNEIKKGSALRASGTFLAVLFALCSLTCQNLFDPPKQAASGTETEGIGYVSLSISGIGLGRTILPYYNPGDYNYRLDFVASLAGTSASFNVGYPFVDQIALQAGTYKLTVTAIESGVDIAQGVIDGMPVSAGSYNSQTVYLKFLVPPSIIPGTGTFSWNIQFPESANGSKITIKIDNYSSGVQYDVINGTISDEYFTGNRPSMPTGYYNVLVTVYDKINPARTVLVFKEILHIYNGKESVFNNMNFNGVVSNYVYKVTDFGDSGLGTLRNGITSVPEGSTIVIEGVTPNETTITLESMININKNITIEGNGVIINGSFTGATLMEVNYNKTVAISRVRFKGSSDAGGIVVSDGANFSLESCIFSDFTTMTKPPVLVYANGNTTIKGCTFHNNYYPITIPFTANVFLTGNLFYGNTTHSSGINSQGYNAVDKAFGTGAGQSGFTAGHKDIDSATLTALPISATSFKLLNPEGGTIKIIDDSLPLGYPIKDFYGNDIPMSSLPAAAGAVQETILPGFTVDYSANKDLYGQVSAPPFHEGITYTSAIILTATPETPANIVCTFSHWLVEGVPTEGIGGGNTLEISTTSTVVAVFNAVYTVNNPADTNVSGTLRYALANAIDNDSITISTQTITLGSVLNVPEDVTIEGNGVTITGTSSQLLNVTGDVTISRVYFKGGSTNGNGAAINSSGNLTLTSCIFSGNTTSSGNGGAIYTSGDLNVLGCTFHGNTAASGSGGAIYSNSGTVSLTGNLFFGNDASQYPVVNSNVISVGYNAVDKDFGTANTESGWGSGATGDTKIDNIPISTNTFKILPDTNGDEIKGKIPSGIYTDGMKDWYGTTITYDSNAAIGAVQTVVGGYQINLTYNDSSRGSVDLSGDPHDADEMYAENASVTLTPDATGPNTFGYWLVDEVRNTTNPLELTVTGNIAVKAVFLTADESKGWGFIDFEGIVADTANTTYLAGGYGVKLDAPWNIVDNTLVMTTTDNYKGLTIEVGSAPQFNASADTMYKIAIKASVAESSGKLSVKPNNADGQRIHFALSTTPTVFFGSWTHTASNLVIDNNDSAKGFIIHSIKIYKLEESLNSWGFVDFAGVTFTGSDDDYFSGNYGVQRMDKDNSSWEVDTSNNLVFTANSTYKGIAIMTGTAGGGNDYYWNDTYGFNAAIGKVYKIVINASSDDASGKLSIKPNAADGQRIHFALDDSQKDCEGIWLQTTSNLIIDNNDATQGFTISSIKIYAYDEL